MFAGHGEDAFGWAVLPWWKAYKTTEKRGVRSVGVKLRGLSRNAEKFGMARLLPSRLGGKLLIQNGPGRRGEDVKLKNLDDGLAVSLLRRLSG
jgi:hypothetical protein